MYSVPQSLGKNVSSLKKDKEKKLEQMHQGQHNHCFGIMRENTFQNVLTMLGK